MNNHHIAILMANGFNENQLVEVQKTLKHSDMVKKMVSPESGVVNGWADNNWGCFFPVDVAINEALASDFSGLIIMGGDKSIHRLNKTAHTERFIGSFVRAGKPVLALGEAKELVPSDDNGVVAADISGQVVSEFVDMVLEGDVVVDMAA